MSQSKPASVPATSETRVFGMKAETGRWMFVVVGLIIQLCLGAVYAWSVFKKPLMVKYGFSNMESLLPYMLFLAFFAVLMPFGGRFITKYGPKWICLIGSIMMGLGWILAGLIGDTVIGICISYGIIGGAGVGLAYGAPIAVSNRWFPDKKGLAVGLTVGGFGLSALIVVNVGNAIIGKVDVNNHVLNAFLILGIIFLAVSVLLSLLLRFPKPDWKPAGWTPRAGTAAPASISPRQMLKTPSFYAVWFCFIVGALAGLMAIGIAKPVGSDLIKIAAGTATTLTSVFAIFNFAGRPAFGWLTDRITPRWAAVISFVLIGVAAILMLMSGAGDTAMYVIAFALFYLGLGGWLAIAPTTTAIFFGPKDNADNYGIVFTAYGVGAVIGNLIAGRTAQVSLSSFYPVAILAGIGIIVAILMLKPPKAQAKK